MNYFTLPDGQTKFRNFHWGVGLFGADVWGDYDQGLAIRRCAND